MTTPTTPICACDGETPLPPTNLPGLAQVAYRNGTFVEFRRALLTPLHGDAGSPQVEFALAPWRSDAGSAPSVPDLGVMAAEWWAYLADVLCFYNERIANEGFLRTTLLPESPARLIGLLGYRPRPALGAMGTLAALVTPGQSATLPAGLQFQSKPGPGQAPQIFELDVATPIAAPDAVAANAGTPHLLEPSASTAPFRLAPAALLHPGRRVALLPVGSLGAGRYDVLVQGVVTSLDVGAPLLLGPGDGSSAPVLAMLRTIATEQPGGGVRQTRLGVALPPGATPPALTAASGRLQRATQGMPLWTINGRAVDGGTVQLAGLARQIRAGDRVVLATASAGDLLQVEASTDRLGDASTAGGPTTVAPSGAGATVTPMPVLHTELAFAQPVPAAYTGAGVTVHFGWADVGTLLDQPPAAWDGTGSATLTAIPPARFPAGSLLPVIVGDATGAGVLASVTSSRNDTVAVSASPRMPAPWSPPLQPPLQVLYNPLPVSRGKTIAGELLGAGDATVAGQDFTLSKSPVTWLDRGAGPASSIALTVGGVPWTEVASFYGQAADARVFVTREDEQGRTHVEFGDGIDGARLPTGGSVVATYRIGAGADAPPAGKLTVLGQAWPGLRSVLNPIAVSGGADPDPPALLQQDAPRSVLTFGRAVSILDYQAIATLAAGVTRARAVWAWDPAARRAGVCVYVAGTGDVVGSANAKLAADGDPNRPVAARPATPRAMRLNATLLVTAGMDFGAIAQAVTSALADPGAGLFAPSRLAIGQALFDSQIEAACLAVDGAIAITAMTLTVDDVPSTGSLHVPGESGFFTLAPDDVALAPDSHG
jgi:hypothetical protein